MKNPKIHNSPRLKQVNFLTDFSLTWIEHCLHLLQMHSTCNLLSFGVGYLYFFLSLIPSAVTANPNP
jgi:hypothetical protein